MKRESMRITRGLLTMGHSASGKVANAFLLGRALIISHWKRAWHSVNNVNPFYPRMFGWNWASSCMPGYTYIQKNVFNSDQRILTISFKTDTTLHFNNLESSLLKILVELALEKMEIWKFQSHTGKRINNEQQTIKKNSLEVYAQVRWKAYFRSNP